MGMGGGVAPPLIPVAAVNVSLPPPPDLRLDLNWLDLDEFMPPGARRVGPVARLAVELAPIQRTRFPSAELSVSPDKRYILYHDGLKRKQQSIHHWLMLLKNEPLAYPNTILGTRLAFEASWSEDSQRFAVTHFVGDNASEVFVVDVADLEKRPIEVRPWLELHFPPHLVNEPIFVKAYRWTRDGRLVVRALARSQKEPYELFGCELAVGFSGGGEPPRTTYLRGFIKEQAQAAP